MIGSGIARTAAAFEWDLPGERRLAIHGFYESRLLFVGSELPLNGATWSSFRQVLSTEFELSLLPDGYGPFDSVFLFSRFLISYDCIYTRACGLANSADSSVGDSRRAVRQPLSLAEDVVNKAPYFAGLLELKYRPGSLVPAQQPLNPGRRYRDCENSPGVFSNPFPLAVFCNLENRSPLDNPNNQTGNKFWEVRAGSFSPNTRPSLTAAARSMIGDEEFARIQNLLIAGSVLSVSQNAYRSALLAEASETGDALRAAALRAEAAEILGTPENTFDANILELLGTRADPNRFAILAGEMAPELLTAQWGSSELRNLVWPFLASINTPIRPQGYFASGAALDSIGHYDQALGETITATVGGLPQTSDADGYPVYTAEGATNRANPFFVGPDGIRDTADDLPFVERNERAIAAGYRLALPIQGTDLASFDGTFGRNRPGVDAVRPVYARAAQIDVASASSPGTTKQVELYGVYSPEFLVNQGCRDVPGASYSRASGQCVRGTENVSAEALASGCRVIERTNGSSLNVGANADGDCIEINTVSPASGSQLQFEVLGLLGDLAARPAEAVAEPLDATDFRSVAEGGVNNTLPGRPRSSDGGLVFQSPGMREQYEKYGHSLVSNLDLEYSVDQLQWNHGASQTEHEFAEGYLEFDLARSQVYARVGKLIVVWGKTELYRNQDRNNPLDTGNGIFAPLDEQRVGQWALDLTFSPKALMQVGPFEDLRLELLTIFNPFEPTDNGKCGEGTAVDIVCRKSFAAMANGLTGTGVIGELRPYNSHTGIERWDFGARVEGRFDRFTFAVSDFYGWDDTYYLDLVQQYERASDPTTGAPLSVNAIDQTVGCRVRTNAAGQEVGPDGNPLTTGDNLFPSAGECLLWDPPATPDAPQKLRSTDSVAALQTVNQSLFHSLCAYTYDPDDGFCPLDRLNNALEFGHISSVLGGLGLPGAVLLEGVETIQEADPDGSTSVTERGSTAFLTQAFLTVEPLAEKSSSYQDLGVSLRREQAALLGCGPAYASPCSSEQQAQWTGDSVIVADLTRDPTLGPSRLGGIDLMNADASVVTQEFVGLKAVSAGALVGTKLDAAQQIYFQAGVNFSRDGQRGFDLDRDFSRLGVQQNSPPLVDDIEAGSYLPLTPNQVIGLGVVGRAGFQIQAGEMREADSWIEPMPWTVNQEMLEKFGAIVFNTDPGNVLALDLAQNQWNLIDPDRDRELPVNYSDIDGEYCARWMTANDAAVSPPFNLGCTALETLSANL